MIKASKNSDKNVITISVESTFDYSAHKDFRDTYRDITTTGTSYIVDLSKTTYMDSSALGMLLLLKEHAEKAAGKVELRGATGAVEKILNLSNFGQLFTIK